MRRTKSATSVSAVNGQPKAGIGKLNYNGCKTEEDYQKRNNDFWAPPELRMLGKASRFDPPRTSKESRASSDEHGGKQRYVDRRHSDESVLQTSPLLTSLATPSTPLPIFARQSFLAKLPQTPESVRASSRFPEVVDDGDIARRLEGLLVTSNEDRDETLRLEVSRYTRERFERQAEELIAREKAAALFAAKELRMSRRQPLRPLIQRLDKRWEEKVYLAKSEQNPQRVLATAIKGTPLTGKDFATLLGSHAWLNDEIINAYLEWIEDAANRAAAAEAKVSGERAVAVPKFLAHNSFFYQALSEKGPAQTERLMKRRKVPGKCFMQVDTMFVPICTGNHWTVGVVRPIAKTIEYFDSFGGSAQTFVRLMRNWLKFQLGDAYIEEEWKVPRTGCAVQSNGYDCGVFACTTSLCVAIGLDTSCYSETDMTQQRRNIAAVLLNEGFVGDFAWGKGF